MAFPKTYSNSTFFKVLADEQKKLHPDCWKRKRSLSTANNSGNANNNSNTNSQSPQSTATQGLGSIPPAPTTTQSANPSPSHLHKSPTVCHSMPGTPTSVVPHSPLIPHSPHHFLLPPTAAAGFPPNFYAAHAAHAHHAAALQAAAAINPTS